VNCSAEINSREYDTVEITQDTQKLYHVGRRFTFVDMAAVISMSTIPRPPTRLSTMKAYMPSLLKFVS
jgi:hypothetical protein